MASDEGNVSDLSAGLGNLAVVPSYNDKQIISRQSSETSASSLSVGTATAPVLAANHIILNSENSLNSKLVGVLVEEHHHYGSNGRRKKKLGKNFKPDRNSLTKLIAKYKEEEGWMYPLPWEQNLKLEPEEFYVELTLDAYSKCGLYNKGLKVKVEDVFDPVLPGGLPVQRVLIQGNAGFGKSSLCQKAVYDWSHGISTFRALPWDLSLPVLINLRFLDKDSNLEELILELIASHYSPLDKSQDVNFFVRCLGRNLIIILDGYDELDHARQTYVKGVLEACKREDSLLCSASILVTTRPNLDEKFLLMFEKHYFITSISDKNVELLIKKFNTYTGSLLQVYLSQLDKILSRFYWYPETRLLEKCLCRQTGKYVFLRDMPPLIIAVICWVIKQPRVELRSNDIMYNCVELLSKRCNERENFGFTDDRIGKILFKFGLLCFKIENTVISEKLLKSKLGMDFSFLALTGILKCSENDRGQTLWEPVHKSFLDAVVEAALACDEADSLSRSKIKAFLTSDITTSCGVITLHVSSASNSVLIGGTELSYYFQQKSAFCKWNDKYKNVSYLHKFKTPGDSKFSLIFKHFSTGTLKQFCKDFPNFQPIVTESNLIQDLLSVYGNKRYIFSLGINSPVEDSLELFFPGTGNVFSSLLKCGVRFLHISKLSNEPFCSKSFDKLLGISDQNASKKRLPSKYFSNVMTHFCSTGLQGWEISLYIIPTITQTTKNSHAGAKVTQQPYTLRYNSSECPVSQCKWKDVREVKLSYFDPRNLLTRANSTESRREKNRKFPPPSMVKKSSVNQKKAVK